MSQPLSPNAPSSAYELQNFYLFAGLEPQHLARVRASMRRLTLGEREFLFEHGQPAQHFYILLDGHVKLTRVSLEGTEKVIEIVKPGESFAEAIMFMSKQVYPVTAQSVNTSTVLAFENKVFLGILEQSFDTCRRVMWDMSMRLRSWLNEIDHLTLQNATYRLINYLLYQVPEGHRGAHCEIGLGVPKHVIASRLSIKPETFSRLLNQLSAQGLIQVDGNSVYLPDVEALRLYAQRPDI